MGYTHYFKAQRNFTDTEWDSIRGFAKTLFKVMEPGILGDLMGDGGKPQATATRIAFNGIGDESHESFVIKKSGTSDFCKTAQKSYDIAVVAMLCYINYVATDAFLTTSDGDVEDWIDGCNLASECADVVLTVPLHIRERMK